jgi:4-amino-4-deoxy-L-arabinose transferase-like glycosyltransferase
LCAWVALIGILMEPWAPNVWQRIRVVATSARRDWRWYASVALVTMSGIAVRAWQLDSVPIPISDESAAALYSLDMWHGFITNPFISGWYEFPSLWFMLQAPFVGYLGKTFLAIRLLPMLLGSACVPLLVWAVRPVLPRPAALLAGLSVALLGLHVHFSRYGLNNIADSLSSIILLGLLVRYATRPSRGYAVAIGITLGIAIYGYASARMYPLIVFGIVLGLAVRNPKHIRSHVGFLVTMALASLVVAGPLLMHYVQEPNQFWATVRRNSTLQRGDDGLTGFERFALENNVTVPELVVRNILYTLQALVWGPTEGWFATQRAVLAPFTAVLAVLGLVHAIRRREDIILLTTLVWLGVFCLLSIVNWPVAAGQRLVGVLAATGLLVGVGAQAVIDLQIPRVDRRIPILVAILIVLSGGVQSMAHYFNVFVRRESSVGDPLLHRAGVAALIAQRLPERTWVDVYASDSFNYQTTPVLHFAMARLDANLVFEADAERIMPPIIFFPAEVADRVIMDNRYSVYELVTKHGEVLLSVAVRDDAPWADRIVQQTIAENQ